MSYSDAILHRLLVLTTCKPHVTHLYNQVTIKPSQRLHMVNQLYPYTVKFTEETSTPRLSAEGIKPTKRPHQKSENPANTSTSSHKDRHVMSGDSPPPKKTPPPRSDKSVSYYRKWFVRLVWCRTTYISTHIMPWKLNIWILKIKI